jgi:hypothetical protein
MKKFEFSKWDCDWCSFVLDKQTNSFQFDLGVCLQCDNHSTCCWCIVGSISIHNSTSISWTERNFLNLARHCLLFAPQNIQTQTKVSKIKWRMIANSWVWACNCLEQRNILKWSYLQQQFNALLQKCFKISYLNFCRTKTK